MRRSAFLRPKTIRGTAAWQQASIAGLLLAVLASQAAADGVVSSSDMAQVVAFAGLESGAKVAHFLPASGDLVGALCRAVGDAGHVYAIAAPREQAADTRPAAKGAPAEPADVPVGEACPNLTASVLHARSFPAPELHSDSDDPGWVYEYWAVRLPVESFAAPEPLDLIWIKDRYHALHGSVFGSASPVRVGTALRAALKPGGVLVIEDFASKPGTGVRDAVALHRIDSEQVKREMAAAGFELVAESDALRNPEDRRRANAHSIDRPDRFLLEFRKP